MPTVSFKIGSVSAVVYNCVANIDEDGFLVGLTGTGPDDETYDCLIQLVPDDKANFQVQCCPPGQVCTPGSCGP